MKQIFHSELAGRNDFDNDIYDEKAKLVYKCGEELTPGLLMRLSYKKLFIKAGRASDNSRIIKIPGQKYPSIISEKSAKILLNNTKNILKKVHASEKPDKHAYIDSAEIILEEVSNKLEKIECISRLRIYDEYTFSHTINVSTMTSALGIILELGDEKIQELTLGALLHDLGKMLVPKEILNKPGKLDEEEFRIMKSHSLLGYNYIKENLDVSEEIAGVALDHQEKYNGSGYPNGLKGKEINLYAQVTSIADVYDALISNRVYKRAFDPEEALNIMVSESEKSFNPYMLKKFLKLTEYKDKINIL